MCISLANDFVWLRSNLDTHIHGERERESAILRFTALFLCLTNTRIYQYHLHISARSHTLTHTHLYTHSLTNLNKLRDIGFPIANCNFEFQAYLFMKIFKDFYTCFVCTFFVFNLANLSDVKKFRSSKSSSSSSNNSVLKAINFTTCQHLVVHLNGISENSSPFR